jgi:hypothetical protein
MAPAVIPKLSELPSEPERRNGILDSAHAQPGPEHQPTTKKARKAETAAATAAAIIGSMLSNHENVTLGGGTTFDENQIVAPQPEQKPKPAPPPLETDESLVPWVTLPAN